MNLHTLQALIRRAPFSPDIMIAAILVLAVAMMIMPLPLIIVDLLIGFSLGFAVLLMLVALYVTSPVQFTTLPGIILLSTVFRLALAITTTRLILSEGDAGDIVRTFGEFVIAGSVVVGLVIFLIVTLVQFIVVAKGAERVAEVGARFSLDAMPGKQMAIDAELRNGDIDQAEARRRRALLEQESSFYGAMDGAMKFVKGDAVAGLVIIVINLIGGISIGMLSRGMSVGDAVREYSLLSIGDALISQIPALLLSLTAAAIVTRVTGEEKVDLGRDIFRQLGADHRALRLAAIVLVGMGFIPGFPTAVFLVLALAFGAASLVAGRRPVEKEATATAGPAASPAAEAPAQPTPAAGSARVVGPSETLPVMLHIAPALADSIDATRLARDLDRVRAHVSDTLGVLVPEVGITIALSLQGHRFRVDVEGVPVEEDDVRPERLLLRDDPANIELLDVPFDRQSGSEAGIPDRIWVHESHAVALARAGIGHQDCGEILAARVGEVVTRFAPRFLGIQETKALLARHEARYGDLIKEVLRTIPMQKVADVLRRLLDEGIAVRNMRLILEALAEWGDKEGNVVLLTEYVRSALKRQICHRYANGHRVVAAYVLERATEDVLRAAVRDTAVGPYLVLDEQNSERLLSQGRRLKASVASDEVQPVMLASVDIRRFVRGFLIRNGLDIPVLSYQDLANDFTVQPVGSINLVGEAGASAGRVERVATRDVVTALG